MTQREANVQPDLSRQAVTALLAAYGALHAQLSRPLERDRLSLARVRVLEVLAEHNERSMSQLGAALLISRTAVTNLIESLVADGLVERVDQPIDRRRRIVRITSVGYRALDDALPAHQQRVATLFADLLPEEQHHLIALLLKLAQRAPDSA